MYLDYIMDLITIVIIIIIFVRFSLWTMFMDFFRLGLYALIDNLYGLHSIDASLVYRV